MGANLQQLKWRYMLLKKPIGEVGGPPDVITSASRITRTGTLRIVRGGDSRVVYDDAPLLGPEIETQYYTGNNPPELGPTIGIVTYSPE